MGYSLKQEVEFLKMRASTYEKIIEVMPNAFFTDISYINKQNEIILNRSFKKIDKIDVFSYNSSENTGFGQVNTTIVAHASEVVNGARVYSFGINICRYTALDYYNTNNRVIDFFNYQEEFESLKVSKKAIKNIELYAYDRYLKSDLTKFQFKKDQYIPLTFKKYLIFND